MYAGRRLPMTEAHTMTDEELLDGVAERLSGDLSDLLAADDGTTASPLPQTGDAMVVCPVPLRTDRTRLMIEDFLRMDLDLDEATMSGAWRR